MISALPSCAPLLVVPYFCAVYFCAVYFCDVWYRVAAQLGSRLASPDEVRLQSMSIVVPCATLVREFLFFEPCPTSVDFNMLLVQPRSMSLPLSLSPGHCR